MNNWIVCIPDTLDSFEFLHAARKYQLKLLLVIKEKWLKDVQSFPWEHLIVKDFGNQESIAESIKAFFDQKPGSKIVDCLVFAESNIELMGYLNSFFHTNGLTRDQALLFRDKYTMKVRAQQLGIPAPLFARLQDRSHFYDELKKICEQKKKPLCFLIKPRKSWACRGIQKFSSIDLAEREVSQLENVDDFLIEEYLDAEMFHIGGIIQDKKAICSVVVKHDASLFEMGRSLPEHMILHTIDQNSEDALRIKEAHDRIVAGFGYQNGISFFEFFKEISSGQIYLCETAARHPALHVPKMYEIVSGKNYFDEWARILSGQIECGASKCCSSFAGIISFAALPGTIAEVDSLDRFNDPEIIYKQQPSNLIGTVFQSISFRNTIGQIIIRTKTESRCMDLLQSYCQGFKYRVV
jgi:hypothetical protein